MKELLRSTLVLLLFSLCQNTYAYDHTVDCGSGGIVQNAVDIATPGQSIHIVGTCNGQSVLVVTNRLTLDGDGGGVIDALGAPSFVMTIKAAQGVVIKNLDIINGLFGITVGDGANITVVDVLVDNHIVFGITLSGASAMKITDSVVSNNGVSGIEGAGGITVDVSGTLSVTDNGVFGADIDGAVGVIFASGSTSTFSGNIIGLQVAMSSTVFVRDNALVTASNNSFTGLTVVSTSAMFLFNGHVVADNNAGFNGVSINSNSSLDVDSTSTLSASNNGRHGLRVESSTVNVFTSDPLNVPSITVNNNAINGISLDRMSSIDITQTAFLIANDNAGSGVWADDGSTLTLVNSTLTGNGDYDIKAQYGSRMDITNSTVDETACDKTVLVRGDEHECDSNIND